MKQALDSIFSQPIAETGPSLEAKRLQEDIAFTDHVREKILGANSIPGLLNRVDTLRTESEVPAISNELLSLVVASGLAFLSGHAQAGFEGVAGFRSSLFRLESTLNKLCASAEEPSHTSEKEAAFIIEFAGRLTAIHPEAVEIGQAMPDLPLAVLKRVEQPDQIDNFGLIANRVLKTRLHSFVAEKNLSHLLEGLPETLGLETNDLSAATMSEYEVDDEYGIFNKLNCDEALKERLLGEYLTLAGELAEPFVRVGGLAADVLSLRKSFPSSEEQLARPEEYKAYLKKYAEFETRWLRLRLAFAYYTPIS